MGRWNRDLEATISKRRKGLFREASDLGSSSSSGSEMGVIVFSPANEPHVYGHPSAVSVLERFLGEQDSCTLDDDDGVVIDDDLEAHQEKEEKAVQCGIDHAELHKYGLCEHYGEDEQKKNIAILKHYIKMLDFKIDQEMKRKDSRTKDNNSEIGSSSGERDQSEHV